MTRSKWSKTGNILAYVIIQSTFGILYFTFDVCTKVDKHEGGRPNNLTYTDVEEKNFCNNDNTDKSTASQSLRMSLPSTNSMCANLQNGTKMFENSVFFSKLEDVEWVRTCMISVMGVVAFIISVLSAWCYQPQVPSGSCVSPLRCSSIISHKILLFTGCSFMLCGTFLSTITVKKSLPLFILT